MFHVPSPRWTLISLIGVALLANGQPATPPAGAASSTASADLSYRSAMEGYQRFSDEKVGSWREANDNVGRIGGWREYAKEAQQGDGSAQAAPKNSSGTTPAPATRDPHAEHGKH
jgi:hypothetical protein